MIAAKVLRGIEGLGTGNTLLSMDAGNNVKFTIGYKVTEFQEGKLTVDSQKIVFASSDFEMSFDKDCSFKFKAGHDSSEPKRWAIGETQNRLMRASVNSGNTERIKFAIIWALDTIAAELEMHSPHESIHEIGAIAAKLKLTEQKLVDINQGRISRLRVLVEMAQKTSQELGELQMGWIPQFNTIVRNSKENSSALSNLNLPDLEQLKEDLIKVKVEISNVIPGQVRLLGLLETAIGFLEEKKPLYINIAAERIRAVSSEINNMSLALRDFVILRAALQGIAKTLKRSKCEIKPIPFRISLRSVIDSSTNAFLDSSPETQRDQFIDML